MTEEMDVDAELLAEAKTLHRAGRLDEAEALYLELLDRNIENPGAWHYLGILCHQRGDSEQAAEFILRALGLVPGDAGAWYNLGNVYKQSGQMDEAASAYVEALKIDPVSAEGFTNLGEVFIELGMLEEARKALIRAIELKPGFAKAYGILGRALTSGNSFLEALYWPQVTETYRTALKKMPYSPAAYRGFWRTLHLMKRYEEAESVLRDWLEREPDNPYARHMLAAYTGENAPEVAADDYVRSLFDGFAPSFDVLLTEKLDYRAPGLVAAAACAVAPDRGAAGLDVADLGCGTGLCGPLLRPLAARLTGVDLSPKMLEQADARSVYDVLLQEELTGFLNGRPDSFDLLAAADTLVYLGELHAFAEAAWRALRPGGALVFTVEKSVEGQDKGFQLQHSGRYTHRGDYLDQVLRDAGFHSPNREEVLLRKEVGEYVRGWLVTTVRSDTKEP